METILKEQRMMAKIFFVILLLLILISNGTSFGRRRSSSCRKGSEQILSEPIVQNPFADQSATDHYYDCDTTEFGIVQKIPYLRVCSSCDAIEINFSSACIRCGMCLAIAGKINQTLLEVYEMMTPGACLNDTEVELLLRTICNHSFEHYSLREVDGIRFISDRLPGSILVATSADGLWGKKLRDLCHYYLDEIGEVQLFQQWQEWCEDDEKFPNLSNVMCRNSVGTLRDCRNMDDINKYESPFKTYNAKVKVTASYGKYDF